MTSVSTSTYALANYLRESYWLDTRRLPHVFDTSKSNVLTVDLTGLTAAGRTLARAALDAWETLANVSFKEVDGSAHITFDDDKAGAFCSSWWDGNGNTTSSIINVSTSWLSDYGSTVGSYGLQTYIHEIGHALGLGHPGSYNGTASFATDAEFACDNWQTSIMSYFSQSENLTVDASYATLMSPMVADILAIQQLYGQPKNGPTAGNTTYGVGSNLGTYLDGVFGSGAGHLTRSALTIYDQGGYDRVDFSNDTQSQDVDLRGGRFSDVYGLTGNLGVAFGTVLEAYFAGSGNDAVLGNAANNRLRLNAGDDVGRGGAGHDKLYGCAGADRLIGGTGNDYLVGGSGGDRLNGGDGNDAMKGSAGNDSLVGGSGKDRLDGGAGNDAMKGGAGNDYLVGGSGKDRLDGGAGNDVLNGGKGADSFIFSSGDDRVAAFQNNMDTLVLDDALWGGRSLSVGQVLKFAHVASTGIVFDFADGHSLRVEGMTNLRALANDLAII